jgi:hypothetical protein
MLRVGLAADRTDREQADVVDWARQFVWRDAAAGRAAPRDGAQLAEPVFGEQPPALPAWQPREPERQVARAELRLAQKEPVSLRPARPLRAPAEQELAPEPKVRQVLAGRAKQQQAQRVSPQLGRTGEQRRGRSALPASSAQLSRQLPWPPSQR